MSMITPTTNRVDDSAQSNAKHLDGAPVFIIGCPRSGTTFLGELLNKHPRVLITNELRLMNFLAEVFGRVAGNRHLLYNPDYRDRFISHAKSRAALLVRSFYADLAVDTGKSVAVWGDKTPGYADPLHSPGCLALAREIFPDAKWIHIHRDPRAVIHSLVAKKWQTLPAAIDLWARITRSAREFGAKIPRNLYLEVSHEQVLSDLAGVSDRIFAFLGLPIDPAVDAFIRAERQRRTPVSDPINLPSETDSEPHHGLTDEELTHVISSLGDRFDDVESMLRHYESTSAGRSSREALQNQTQTSSPCCDSLSSEQVDAPEQFETFLPVDPKSLLGELEARIIGFSVLVNSRPGTKQNPVQVQPGDRIDLALRVMTLRNFPHLVCGVTILTDSGSAVAGGNNFNSGLGCMSVNAGIHTLLLSFRWPDIGQGNFLATLGVGEGSGGPADGDSNVVQCWAPAAIDFTQKPFIPQPGVITPITLLHASMRP